MMGQLWLLILVLDVSLLQQNKEIKMRIQVLGVGQAFSPEIGNSSIILWDDDRGFLIDCGYTVYPILKQKKLIDRIDKVFITHNHDDHIGSLASLFYHKRFVLNQKIKFFGISDHMNYLKAIDPNFDFEKQAKDYFILDEESIQTIPVNHSEGVPAEAFYNYGVLFSGDTSESLLETPEARTAKIILHEVSFADVPVHAYFNKLANAPVEVKAKTWLYHYGVGENKIYESRVRNHGFAGMLVQDQTITL